VAVGVERDGDGRVTEPLGDDLGMRARGQGDGGVGMPEVVDADDGDFRGACQLSEPTRDRVWAKRRTVLTREDEAEIAVIGAPRQPLLCLPLPV
jgi:hypothetical protein